MSLVNLETTEIEKQSMQIEEEILLQDQPSLLSNKRTWKKSQITPDQLPLHIKNDPLIWQIFSRLHYEDRNLLGIIVGETGAGKSCTAIAIAKKVDITPLGNGLWTENFIIKAMPNGEPHPTCRVVFGASDFLKLVRSNLPKGSVIIWDEAGIGNDNTNWYEKKSQIIKHILQSFRSKNLCVLMTVPDEESITIGARRLIHLLIDVETRNDSHATCTLQWYQRNRKTKKVYKKTTAFEDREGNTLKINKYFVPKIDDDIEREYNKIKNHVLENINKFYEKEMVAMEQIEKEKLEVKLNKDELGKFNLLKAVEWVRQVRDYCYDFEKNKYDSNKIVFFLQQKNMFCNIGNARTTAINALELDKKANFK